MLVSFSETAEHDSAGQRHEWPTVTSGRLTCCAAGKRSSLPTYGYACWAFVLRTPAQEVLGGYSSKVQQRAGRAPALDPVSRSRCGLGLSENFGQTRGGFWSDFGTSAWAVATGLPSGAWHQFLQPFHDARTCFRGSMLGCELTGANLLTSVVAGGLYHAASACSSSAPWLRDQLTPVPESLTHDNANAGTC